MEKTCNNCGNDNIKINIPYVVHEAEINRQERQIKRMWIALIVVVSMFFASNLGWMIFESQFETISYEQDGDGINNVNYGTQGDLNNEPKGQNQAQEE